MFSYQRKVFGREVHPEISVYVARRDSWLKGISIFFVLKSSYPILVALVLCALNYPCRLNLNEEE